ncbi:hypothetical protein, partial [Nostoc sp.]|uniref:hypothetical protein n=1 Tax=Nostoc sp. TaxID=1180 RepID=UPI002FFC29C3
PFPNSEVKRCCGHDSLGVALRKNSSMPGFIIQLKPPHDNLRRLEFFTCWQLLTRQACRCFGVENYSGIHDLPNGLEEDFSRIIVPIV